MLFTPSFSSAEITAFKDVALGISALVTCVVAISTATFAYKGLNKWQDETKGKASFGLAKKLLEYTYAIEIEISHIRQPKHFNSELIISNADALNITKVVADTIRMMNMYDSRSENLKKQLIRIKTLKLETKVLWGNKESEKVFDLVELSNELIISTQRYARINEMKEAQIEKDLANSGIDAEERKLTESYFLSEFARLNIITCSPINKDKTNKFCKRVKQVIKGIEDITEEQLKRKD